nr:hypothetical protein SHINE37_42911 [Rhizobiaceae bacterium]
MKVLGRAPEIELARDGNKASELAEFEHALLTGSGYLLSHPGEERSTGFVSDRFRLSNELPN